MLKQLKLFSVVGLLALAGAVQAAPEPTYVEIILKDSRTGRASAALVNLSTNKVELKDYEMSELKLKEFDGKVHKRVPPGALIVDRPGDKGSGAPVVSPPNPPGPTGDDDFWRERAADAMARRHPTPMPAKAVRGLPAEKARQIVRPVQH